MIAKPSIAFNDFSGTAKDVTARTVQGRNVLSVRAYQSKVFTPSQAATRNQLSKISREYKQLSDSQMQAWEVLANHLKGISYFGKAAEMTAHNAFVRINSNRLLAGKSILMDAPSHISNIPGVVYDEIWVTPSDLIIKGIVHQNDPLRLVIKMSAGLSAGVSSGWSKTVIVSAGIEDDWGDANVRGRYMKVVGFAPAVGDKVFLELYWMNTDTGFVGASAFDSKICITSEEAEEEGYVKRNKITMDDIQPDSHVSECDVDFSTGAPVISFDTVCLGHSNVASSEVYLNDSVPEDCVGTSMALARGRGDGRCALAAQSYIIWLRNSSWGDSTITFAHRGGYYVVPTEVLGPGILY